MNVTVRDCDAHDARRGKSRAAKAEKIILSRRNSRSDMDEEVIRDALYILPAAVPCTSGEYTHAQVALHVDILRSNDKPYGAWTTMPLFRPFIPSFRLISPVNTLGSYWKWGRSFSRLRSLENHKDSEKPRDRERSAGGYWVDITMMYWYIRIQQPFVQRGHQQLQRS